MLLGMSRGRGPWGSRA